MGIQVQQPLPTHSNKKISIAFYDTNMTPSTFRYDVRFPW